MENQGRSGFVNRKVTVNGIATHIVEIGDKGKLPVLLLHGYPENSGEFETVMDLLKNDYYLVAVDLPGIGGTENIASGEKYAIAAFVRVLIETLDLKDPTLVGHDIGGMVTYAFLKHFPEYLLKAVIMCTAIPGVSPWEEVKRNPHIWHFAFFSVPELPEQLISRKQRILFDYFYDTISADGHAINVEKRERYTAAYSSSEALRTSLEWYRSFSEDEAENAKNIACNTPVLYLRGNKEPGNIDDYTDGLKRSGLLNIRSKLIADSGHFAPEEQPEAVAKAIDDFIKADREYNV